MARALWPVVVAALALGGPAHGQAGGTFAGPSGAGAAGGGGGGGGAVGGADLDSSLHAFIGALAKSLEARAKLEKVSGSVRVDVLPSRGLDAGKVERAFTPRLKKRLRDGGVLVPVSDASWALRCRVTLSEDGGLVWATAVLDGSALLGPASVAASWPVDRELESSLGAVVKPAQTRFVLERLGAVPAGVLDAALVDVDGDGVDEIALLAVDGIRLFRVGPLRLERIGPVVKLGAAGGDQKKWPRVTAGWLARVDTGAGPRLWAVTSAGHSLFVDVRTLKVELAPVDLIPLRGAPGPASSSGGGPLCGGWRYGSPVIPLPLVTLTGGVVRTPSLPTRVRDIAIVEQPGDDAWLLVDEQGQLLSQRAGEPASSLAAERVGDRLALADLDGDGDEEVVTSSASAPGENDHIVLRRIAKDLASSTVVFRSPLSGGSIAASAVGRLDVAAAGTRVDVVLIEEIGKEALAWRLRYAP